MNTVVTYPNNNIPNSKANWVMTSIEKGWDRPSHHFWGLINNNQNIIKELIAQNIDWYFWDMPFYFRYGLHDDFMWRVSKNALYPKSTINRPSDRFDKWCLNPVSYTSGDKILICPSSDTISLWYTGLTAQQWTKKTIRKLKKYTDRPIDVRYKPRSNTTSGPLAANKSFSQQAQGSHCIITLTSLCAVEAHLLGIKTICHPESFAAQVSNTSLSEIENLQEPDPLQWFYNLAYCQFTHKEIESGLAQKCMI